MAIVHSWLKATPVQLPHGQIWGEINFDVLGVTPRLLYEYVGGKVFPRTGIIWETWSIGKKAAGKKRFRPKESFQDGAIVLNCPTQIAWLQNVQHNASWEVVVLRFARAAFYAPKLRAPTYERVKVVKSGVFTYKLSWAYGPQFSSWINEIGRYAPSHIFFSPIMEFYVGKRNW